MKLRALLLYSRYSTHHISRVYVHSVANMTPLTPVFVGGTTPIPHFIYGTAWKEERTADCVLAALRAGFRAVDTAPQLQHYKEALVGEGLRSWFRSVEESDASNNQEAESERRKGIFLQSKVTPPNGHGLNDMPFSTADTPAVQVQKSLNHSLKNLCGGAGQPPLDALLLHAPLSTIEETMTYWQAMESHVPERVIHLGICNVSLNTLVELHARATIKPSIVQNDLRPAHGFDIELLGFCKQEKIVYQAYGVLKGNLLLLSSPLVRWLAHERGVTEPEALYCLILSCWDGYLCILNGTRSEETMKGDLDLLQRIGKLEPYIVNGFWETMREVEGVAWPSDKST